jgi:hypothetical protein
MKSIYSHPTYYGMPGSFIEEAAEEAIQMAIQRYPDPTKGYVTLIFNDIVLRVWADEEATALVKDYHRKMERKLK